MEFKFKRKSLNEMSQTKIFDELEKAAKQFNYIEFGCREFSKIADISGGTVKKRFGGWKKGLEALRRRLQEKGLNLFPRPHAPNRIYSDKDLFDEMERVWQKVGQRPARTEWEMAEPRVSYAAYKSRFGGWTKACLKFIEYKMGGSILIGSEIQKNINEDGKLSVAEKPSNATDSRRSVSPKIRLKVLVRDNYKCVFCGRSPATDIGVRLQIDHKMPFAKGGSSTFANLQTLCQDCNLGKSDEVISQER